MANDVFKRAATVLLGCSWLRAVAATAGPHTAPLPAASSARQGCTALTPRTFFHPLFAAMPTIRVNASLCVR